MPRLAINDFRLGLDKRKYHLNAPPGSLSRLENAHITSGGDIEKRRAFVVYKTLPADTFGLESTSAGLAVFGSKDIAGTVPSPLVYVRCQHPAVLDGAAYDAFEHDMTSVLCSCAFGGVAICFAEFSDGNVFGYENGVLMEQTRAGQVFGGLTATDDIAGQIKARIEDEVDATGVTVELTSSTLDIKAPVGGTYELTVAETSSSGTFATSWQSDGAGGTAGVSANCMLTFDSGNSGTISSITAPDPSDTDVDVELLTSGVTFSSTLANTASLLATEINNTGSGYTAVANDVNVTIYAPLSLGDSLNALSNRLTVTYDGTLAFTSTGALALSAAITPSSVSKSATTTQPRLTITTGSVSGGGSGGTTPYSYAWSVQSGWDGEHLITVTPTNPTGANTAFTASQMYVGTSFSVIATLTITDSDSPANTATATCLVSFTLSDLN